MAMDFLSPSSVVRLLPAGLAWQGSATTPPLTEVEGMPSLSQNQSTLSALVLP